MAQPGTNTVQRKISLPVRWLKSFVEVQSYAAALELRLELRAAVARPFFAALSAQSATSQSIGYLLPAGGGLRISRTQTSGGVPIGGVERLRFLEPLLREAVSLRFYACPGDDVAACELLFAESRLTVLLSPTAARGFSGEGQALAALAETPLDEEVLDAVEAELAATAVISAEELGPRLNHREPATVRRALAALGSMGMVGFDQHERTWFQRQLPFDLTCLQQRHPRLAAAHLLTVSGGVEVLRTDAGVIQDAYVRGSGVEHRVRRQVDGTLSCTCPWHAKHQGKRGACKHILAVGILAAGSHNHA